MKILRKQGLLSYYGINPYSLKIFAWPVAMIKEDLVGLLCLYSPRVPVLLYTSWDWRDKDGNGETEKTAHFPKAVGRFFGDRGENPPPRNSSLGSLPCLMARHCVLCR